MTNRVLLDFLKNTVPKNLKNKFKITEKKYLDWYFFPRFDLLDSRISLLLKFDLARRLDFPRIRIMTMVVFF